MKDYRSVLYSSYHTTFYAENPVDPEAFVELYDLDFPELLPSRKDATILDLGCGTGHFLHYLRRGGYSDIQGIDRSPEQAAIASKLGLPVVMVPDALDFLASRPARFDCVVLNDVLEHQQKNEAVSLLEAILAALRPGGTLIVKVPNMSAFASIHNRYIDLTHEIGFTEQSLKQLLGAVGYREIMVRGNRIHFGLSPKRLLRWLLYHAWHGILRGIQLIELGVDRPAIISKLLIARARAG